MDIFKLAHRKYSSIASAQNCSKAVIAGLALTTIGLSTTAGAATHSYDMIVSHQSYDTNGQSDDYYESVLPTGSHLNIEINGDLPWCEGNACWGNDFDENQMRAYFGSTLMFSGAFGGYQIAYSNDNTATVLYYHAFSNDLPSAAGAWAELLFPTVTVADQVQLDLSHLLSITYYSYVDGWSNNCNCSVGYTSYSVTAVAPPPSTVPVAPSALLFVSGIASLFARKLRRSVALNH